MNENVDNQEVSQEVNIDELVAAKVAEELADIKEKLNGAYSQRDEALSAKAELEEAEKARKVAEMEAAGEHQKIADMKLAELQAKLDATQRANMALTRDHSVNNALAGVEFKSPAAQQMAVNAINSALTQTQEGNWVGPDFSSISEYVARFAADANNSFLFKDKQNVGTDIYTSQGVQPTQSQPTADNRKLSEMSVEEAFKVTQERLRAEGKI